MKYRLIYLLAILFILSSCSDFLDRVPKDTLYPSTFWKTEKDAYLALVGCYNDFEGATVIFFLDCMSDNAYNFHRHEGYQTAATGDISAADPGKEWFNFTVIHRCNNFLANVGNVNFSDPELARTYSSEVRFIRAYAYFFRTNMYGDFPFFTENFDTPEEAIIPRTSRAVIDDFIEKELLAIIPLLPAKDKVAAEGRASKAAAQALLMRMYLYQGKHREALAMAKEIEGYSLFETGYEDLFMLQHQINDESIFAVQRVANDAKLDFTPFLPNSVGGWSSIVPTQQLVDAYEMADGQTIEESSIYDPENPYLGRDPRLRATIIYPGQKWEGALFNSVSEGNADHPTKANNSTKTGYNFKKYVSNLSQYTDFQNTGKSVMLFRYAEVLLTIAEAKIELNEIDSEVYDVIDQVRTRAGMPMVDRAKYNNQEKLRELIRRERRVEFAYEGMRRNDILRWDIAKDVLNVTLVGCNQGAVTDVVGDPQTGDVNVKLNGEPFFVETRVFADKNILLPIPLKSLDKNSKLEQNPGY